MARQKGIIKLTGQMGGTSYYKNRHGYFARKRSTLSGKRVKTDKAFAPTMQYANEFARTARLNKTLRTSLADMPGVQNNKSTMLRLTKVLLRVKKLDTVSPCGRRCIGQGLQTLAGRALLDGFSWGRHTAPLFIPLQINPHQGTWHIPAFDPRSLKAPAGATHLRLEMRAVKMDLANTRSTVIKAGPVYIDLKQPSGAITLRLPVPVGQGVLFCIISLAFSSNGQLLRGHENTHASIAAISATSTMEEPEINTAKTKWKIRVKKIKVKKTYRTPLRKTFIKIKQDRQLNNVGRLVLAPP